MTICEELGPRKRAGLEGMVEAVSVALFLARGKVAYCIEAEGRRLLARHYDDTIGDILTYVIAGTACRSHHHCSTNRLGRQLTISPTVNFLQCFDRLFPSTALSRLCLNILNLTGIDIQRTTISTVASRHGVIYMQTAIMDFF